VDLLVRNPLDWDRQGCHQVLGSNGGELMRDPSPQLASHVSPSPSGPGCLHEPQQPSGCLCSSRQASPGCFHPR